MADSVLRAKIFDFLARVISVIDGDCPNGRLLELFPPFSQCLEELLGGDALRKGEI